MVERELVISDEKERAKAPERIRIPLTSDDLLYRSIRDCNVSTVGSTLHQRASMIDKHYKVCTHCIRAMV
jgi:hypothetical protein